MAPESGEHEGMRPEGLDPPWGKVLPGGIPFIL